MTKAKPKRQTGKTRPKKRGRREERLKITEDPAVALDRLLAARKPAKNS